MLTFLFDYSDRLASGVVGGLVRAERFRMRVGAERYRFIRLNYWTVTNPFTHCRAAMCRANK